LKNLPDTVENLINLEEINIQVNLFRKIPIMFNKLYKLRNIIFSVEDIVTLFGLNENLIKIIAGVIRTEECEVEFSSNLTSTGTHLLHNIYKKHRTSEARIEEWKKLLMYYKKSPQELANQYILSGKLTDEELNRLIHEADLEELEYLKTHLPDSDNIVIQIKERLDKYYES
jgi:hypothetical protein